MERIELLIKNLTAKDEPEALKVAKNIIENTDVVAFSALVEKSDFLFDFVKSNVAKRLQKVINKSNYKNILKFLKKYSSDYDDVLMSELAKYADEELSDTMYELLEKGSLDEKSYAAKYFSFIPDTIARDLLAEYAFCDEENLAYNSAQALREMTDEDSFNKAIKLLSSLDEFDQLKAVKFLTAFGRKDAIDYIYPVMMKSAVSENIATEIPYLLQLDELINSDRKEIGLNTLLVILSGMPEIIPLSNILNFQLYDLLQNLIQGEVHTLSSLILLKAYKLFELLNGADEYIFDEDKNTKNEISDIYKLLKGQPEGFWNVQKQELANALGFSEKINVTMALSLIREYNLSEFAHNVQFLLNGENDLIKAEAVATLKALQKLELADKDEVIDSIKDDNLRAIVADCFV